MGLDCSHNTISKLNSKFQIAVKPETLKPETWNCSYAAPPDDINWENLTNSKVMWYLKSGLLHGLILFFVVFLTTPKHAAEHFDEFLYLTLGENDLMSGKILVFDRSLCFMATNIWYCCLLYQQKKI